VANTGDRRFRLARTTILRGQSRPALRPQAPTLPSDIPGYVSSLRARGGRCQARALGGRRIAVVERAAEGALDAPGVRAQPERAGPRYVVLDLAYAAPWRVDRNPSGGYRPAAGDRADRNVSRRSPFGGGKVSVRHGRACSRDTACHHHVVVLDTGGDQAESIRTVGSAPLASRQRRIMDGVDPAVEIGTARRSWLAKALADRRRHRPPIHVRLY